MNNLLKPTLLGGLVFAVTTLKAEVLSNNDTPVFYHDTVTVTATRTEKTPFNIPASIDLIQSQQIKLGQPQINLSESLARVPGIVARVRQNYAQDLQISSRGFGARSSFGVRGVRLLRDGIPATMPDGQGQPGIFNLDSVKRIEVLRGPFSALYGNSSGGVIQLFTEDGPDVPTLSGRMMLGSYGTNKTDLKLGGNNKAINYVLDASRFDTRGYREHSAAQRNYFNGKIRYTVDPYTSLTVITNMLSQPHSQDPLGLTKSQVINDARQANALAETFNTRKDVEHHQISLVYETDINSRDNLRVLTYFGDRQLVQYLPFSGIGNLSSGGIVDLDRRFGGADVRWTRKTELMQLPFTFTAGLNYDNMKERRLGFVNNNGVNGALKRDEDNRVFNFDQYVQAEWQFTTQIAFSAGLRHSNVKFDSRDYYTVGANPDDSGHIIYRNTSPVAALLYKAAPGINLYATAGQGFETPTFVELAYRPNGTSGLNFDLRPSKSNNVEAGAKVLLSEKTKINTAVFFITTKDEIVVASSNAGRTTYRNAGETRRYGVEVSLDHDFENGFTGHLASSLLNASFRGDELSGKQLPGVPRSSLFAELAWHHAPSAFTTALEVNASSKVYVNEVNSESAPGYAIANWYAGFEQKKQRWQIKEFIRIDNLFNKDYIGSVIVEDTNGRYYEPAPRRNYYAGISLTYQF